MIIMVSTLQPHHLFLKNIYSEYIQIKISGASSPYTILNIIIIPLLFPKGWPTACIRIHLHNLSYYPGKDRLKLKTKTPLKQLDVFWHYSYLFHLQVICHNRKKKSKETQKEFCFFLCCMQVFYDSCQQVACPGLELPPTQIRPANFFVIIVAFGVFHKNLFFDMLFVLSYSLIKVSDQICGLSRSLSLISGLS